MPAVAESELHFGGLFRQLGGGQDGANSSNRCGRRVALSSGGGSLKESCYFAQFFAKFLFGGHSGRFLRWGSGRF